MLFRSFTVIEGRKAEAAETPDVPDAVVSLYGKEKIDEFNRQQETQSYYILAADQLDSDEAIEMVERSPAFKRDKRKASVQRQPEIEPETRKGNPDTKIFFNTDDK